MGKPPAFDVAFGRGSMLSFNNENNSALSGIWRRAGKQCCWDQAGNPVFLLFGKTKRHNPRVRLTANIIRDKIKQKKSAGV